MPTLKTLHPERNFTQIPNTACDVLPDLESLGYLVRILRPQDGFLPTLEGLVATKTGITMGKATKARRTLIEHGYYAAVKFRARDGKYATDVWRTAIPFTDTDIDEIRGRYRAGTTMQVAVTDAQKQPVRDGHGAVLMRQVVVVWAQVESFRGKELAEPPSSRPLDSDGSVRPAKTGKAAGRTDPRETDPSVNRPLGEPGVYIRQKNKTAEQDTPTEGLCPASQAQPDAAPESNTSRGLSDPWSRTTSTAHDKDAQDDREFAAVPVPYGRCVECANCESAGCGVLGERSEYDDADVMVAARGFAAEVAADFARVGMSRGVSSRCAVSRVLGVWHDLDTVDRDADDFLGRVRDVWRGHVGVDGVARDRHGVPVGGPEFVVGVARGVAGCGEVSGVPRARHIHEVLPGLTVRVLRSA